LNNSQEIKEESDNSFTSNKNVDGGKLETEKEMISENKNNSINYNSNEKENIDINITNNEANLKINNKRHIPFSEKYENDSKQKNIYNMINTKMGRDRENSVDGLDDFNNDIFERKNNINIKYNTIQIQKTIPILLSDEAFNRKMKEYQTEKFRRKKEFESDIEIKKKMSQNESKKLLDNISNENDYLSNKTDKDKESNNKFFNSLDVNLNSNKNNDDILGSPKNEKLKNGISSNIQNKEKKEENEDNNNINNKSYSSEKYIPENDIKQNYEINNNENHPNINDQNNNVDNNINNKENNYLDEKTENNNIETIEENNLDTIEKEKNSNNDIYENYNPEKENLKPNDNENETIKDEIKEQKEKNYIPNINENNIKDMEINITVENNQNNEQITDIKDEQKLKDILGETKSQEDNNPKIENENIEKNNDNDIMIKELEKIDEQDEEQNEDQKEEINNNSQPDIKDNTEKDEKIEEKKEKETIEEEKKEDNEKKEMNEEKIENKEIKEEEKIIENQNETIKEQNKENDESKKDDNIINEKEEEKKEEIKIEQNTESKETDIGNQKYQKKFGDINAIDKNSDKGDKLRNRLSKRLKTLQNKNGSNNNKYTPVRKSEFIGLKAMLLQKQMAHKSNNNSMENSANSSFSEKNENKDNKERKSTIDDIINSIPITRKKKKSKMVFMDE